MTKQQCRSLLIKRRRAIPKSEKEKWDRQIFKRLCDSKELQNADILLIYVSKSEEVDTHELIRFCISQNKAVAAPRCEGENLTFYLISKFSDLQPGNFGVLEPKIYCKAAQFTGKSVCVLPGLGFSKKGDRIGYGRGYYDRFLSGFYGKTIGICYSCCRDIEIPTEPHDRPVDMVIAERW